jgi:apolipoprotein N-acyltransferase
VVPRIRAPDLVLAALSGGLLVLSFPRFDLGFLAWVALVPLLLALDGKRPGQAYLLGWIAGVVFFQGMFAWMWTIPAWNWLDSLVVQVLYLPQYVALWGLGLAWIRRRTGLATILVAPPLWVTLEYIRSHLGFLGLPWMLLGHSQYLFPPVIQVTSITGAYGLSVLIVVVNVAIAGLISDRLRQRSGALSTARVAPGRSSLVQAGVALGLVLAVILHGTVVLSGGGASESLKVALVQGNTPRGEALNRAQHQAILDRHRSLSLEAARHAPDLIIWPETAVPGDVRHHEPLRQAVARVAVETGKHLLVGSAEHAKFTDKRLQGKYYNTLVLFAPDGTIVGEYRKTMLVPFGEYVPLKDVVTWPKALVASMGDLLPGDKNATLSVGSVPFRAVICWEIIFADLFRRSVHEGVRFMVLATNEAWFRDSAAPRQLLAMTAFRAAENRVAIARAANTGITAFVDPFGRIASRLRSPDGREVFVDGLLVGQVSLSHQPTFYTRHGDLFAFLQIALAGAAVIASVWSRRAFRTMAPAWGSSTAGQPTIAAAEIPDGGTAAGTHHG